MDPNAVVAIIGMVILSGVFLMHFSKKTGWPLSLVLLILGIFIGPVFHIINVQDIQSMVHSFAIIVLILVLFDTGYDINLAKIKQSIFESTGLALVGVFSTLFVVFLIGRYLLHFDVYLSILFGALLASTDLTIIAPLMSNMKLKQKLKDSLDIEATLNSVFAVIIAIIMGAMIMYTTNFAEAVGRGLIYHVVTGVIVGFIIGFILLKGMHHLISEDMPAIITVGAILVVYSVTELIGASGVIAALVVGLLYGNSDPAPPKFIMLFGENLQFILVTFVYILLGAMITFDAFFEYSLIAIVLVSSVILVRYFSTRLVLFNESLLAQRLVGVAGPRGIISAILVLTYAHLFPNPQMIISLGFAVILCTSLSVFLMPIIVEKTNNRTRQTPRK